MGRRFILAYGFRDQSPSCLERLVTGMRGCCFSPPESETKKTTSNVHLASSNPTLHNKLPSVTPHNPMFYNLSGQHHWLGIKNSNTSACWVGGAFYIQTNIPLSRCRHKCQSNVTLKQISKSFLTDDPGAADAFLPSLACKCRGRELSTRDNLCHSYLFSCSHEHVGRT